MERMRRRLTDENIEEVKDEPGVYNLFEKNAKVPDYTGSSDDLSRRLAEHKGEGYRSFTTEHTDSTKSARSLEKKIIRKKHPHRNKIQYVYA